MMLSGLCGPLWGYPKRPDMRGLRVGAGETLQASSTHLTLIVVELLDPSCLRSLSQVAALSSLGVEGSTGAPRGP